MIQTAIGAVFIPRGMRAEHDKPAARISSPRFLHELHHRTLITVRFIQLRIITTGPPLSRPDKLCNT
jgi:hypothetical protein